MLFSKFSQVVILINKRDIILTPYSLFQIFEALLLTLRSPRIQTGNESPAALVGRGVDEHEAPKPSQMIVPLNDYNLVLLKDGQRLTKPARVPRGRGC